MDSGTKPTGTGPERTDQTEPNVIGAVGRRAGSLGTLQEFKEGVNRTLKRMNLERPSIYHGRKRRE